MHWMPCPDWVGFRFRRPSTKARSYSLPKRLWMRIVSTVVQFVTLDQGNKMDLCYPDFPIRSSVRCNCRLKVEFVVSEPDL